MPRVALPSLNGAASGIGSDRLDANGAAAVAGTTVPRIHDLARRNQIPHWRVGRAVRFSRKALEAWIENGGTTAQESNDIAA